MTVKWAKRWYASRLVNKALTTPDLSKLRTIPAPLTLPLRRVGVNPAPDLASLTETEPVKRLANVMGMGIWLVSGYDEVRTVLSDTVSYSTDIRSLLGKSNATGPDAIGGLGFTDPPEHTRLRKYLTPEFTRRRLARLEPTITGIVERQLDVVEADGPVTDLVRTFAFPVPFLVICELLGLPKTERERFRQLGHERFDASEGMVGAFGAASKAREFLFAEAVRQRDCPGDGLLGSMVREHGDEIEDFELGGFADGLFLGGYETSASMLGLGTLVLLQNPEAYALIHRDPDSVDSVVEELLRFLTVVQVAFGRFARTDLELFGHQIAAGDVLLCSLTAANRDLAFGSDPHEFNPHRPKGPQQLAFGHGFHRCIGAELAKMELRIAFRAIARRFPDMRLAVDPKDLSFRELSIVYGIESLPVLVRGAPPAVSAARP